LGPARPGYASVAGGPCGGGAGEGIGVPLIEKPLAFEIFQTMLPVDAGRRPSQG